MPTSYTYDDLMLALAREAYMGEEAIDLSTTTAATTSGTSAIFGDLAYGTSGATTTAFHNDYLYLRRFSGLATAGAASTITLRTSMGDLGAANVLANFKIKITAGTSSGDERTISSNTDANPTVVTVDSAWTATPTTTSFYEIYPSSATEDRFIRASRALSTGSFAAATGTVTVAPAFAGNAGSALSIGIGGDFLFCKDNPNTLRIAINRLLRNMRYRTYLPVTLVPDGDMEDSYTLGITASFTQWHRTAAAVTAAKSTTSYPFPFGGQYLNVVSDAVDEYGIQSAPVAVDPDENLRVAALVEKTPTATETGDFDVILYDVTNSTALKTVNVTGQQPCLVYFQQAPASTTEEVAVQVLSSSATSSSFRVGPVFLWSDKRTRYTANNRLTIERGTDPKRVFTLGRGQAIEDDVYHIGELEEVALGVESDSRANTVSVVIPTSSYPMLLVTERRYAELTYDTDTTYAERDMVVQGAMYHIEMARAAALASGNPPLASWHRSRAREYASTYSHMLEGTGISLVEPMRVPQARTAVRLA